MIYVDSSVVLAQLLAEDRRPDPVFWDRTGLITSRLTEYETWNRVHARGLGESHGDDLRNLLARLAVIELASPVLVRALDPFPVGLRTLDSLHLASIEFVRGLGQQPSLATYDARLADGAAALGITLVPLP